MAHANLLTPTPHADVNAMLRGFLSSMQAILGGQFVGMALYGSLALGDFDPQTSDIDFIVITEGDIPDDVFDALREMHAQFDASGASWSGKIEAAYIPRDALRHASPTPALYPQLEKGLGLQRMPLEIGWAFQLHTLHRHGITIAGQDVRGIIEPIDPNDMRKAAEVIVSGWLAQSSSDAEWVAWARTREALSFIVLTLCRILYSLETGDVTSKPSAARWAQEKYGERWSALIEHSLAGLHDTQQAPDQDYAAMMNMLSFTVEHSQPRA
jgi:hypothetical protein